MLEKNRRLGINLGGMILFLGMILLSACDPCRELAELQCKCKRNKDEESECMKSLSLNKSHHYPRKEPSPEICLERLKECSCADLVVGDNRKCGGFRQ